MTSKDGEAEARPGLEQVPGQISRIFFGQPSEYSSKSASYDSYGVPQAPPSNPSNTYYNPNTGYNPNSPGGYYPDAGYNPTLPYYTSFNRDMELTMKLGQGALIAFIIIVVVLVAFILLLCCKNCLALRGDPNAGHALAQPHPFAHQIENGTQLPPVNDVWTTRRPDLSTSSESFLTSKIERTPRPQSSLKKTRGLESNLTGEWTPKSTHQPKNESPEFQTDFPEEKNNSLNTNQNSSSDSMTSQSNPRSLPYYEVTSTRINQPIFSEGRLPPNNPPPLPPPLPANEIDFQMNGLSRWPAVRGRLV